MVAWAFINVGEEVHIYYICRYIITRHGFFGGLWSMFQDNLEGGLF